MLSPLAVSFDTRKLFSFLGAWDEIGTHLRSRFRRLVRFCRPRELCEIDGWLNLAEIHHPVNLGVKNWIFAFSTFHVEIFERCSVAAIGDEVIHRKRTIIALGIFGFPLLPLGKKFLEADALAHVDVAHRIAENSTGLRVALLDLLISQESFEHHSPPCCFLRVTQW